MCPRERGPIGGVAPEAREHDGLLRVEDLRRLQRLVEAGDDPGEDRREGDVGIPGHRRQVADRD